MKLVVIGINEDGQRVDRLVGKLIPRAEKGLIYKAIRKKIVTLNGKKTEPDVRVKEGDELRLFFSDSTLRDLGGTPDTEIIKTTAPHESGQEPGNLKLQGLKPGNLKLQGQEPGNPRKQGHEPGEASTSRESESAHAHIAGYVFSDNIIYEDKDVILVYKPEGVLTQGAGERKAHQRANPENAGKKTAPPEVSLNDLLIDYLNKTGKISGTGETFKPSVCNRLDRNTSGIVVCGCSLKGLREMSGLIHDRKLQKYYLCAVKGIIDEPGDLRGWLVKDEKTNKVRIYKEKPDDPDALNIETRFVPLRKTQNMTLLEVELVTGRPHQIRAHMASTGHPVAGDPKYGDPAFNRLVARQYGIKYQALTAWRLVFGSDCPSESLAGTEFKGKQPDWIISAFGAKL